MMFATQLTVTGECMGDIMGCFNRTGRFSEVVILFEQMDKWSILKSAEHHAYCIKAFAFRGQVSDAVLMMRERPHSLQLPHFEVCSSLLKTVTTPLFVDKSTLAILSTSEMLDEISIFMPHIFDSVNDPKKARRYHTYTTYIYTTHIYHTHIPHIYTTHIYHTYTTHIYHTYTTYIYHTYTYIYHTHIPHIYHTHIYHTYIYHTHIPHTYTTHIYTTQWTMDNVISALPHSRVQ
jgi:hypothetical protein